MVTRERSLGDADIIHDQIWNTIDSVEDMLEMGMKRDDVAYLLRNANFPDVHMFAADLARYPTAS